MCQSGPERKNMPRGTFVFQKSSVLPTTVTVAPRYCAYAAVAMLYGPAPITKSAVSSISILLQTRGQMPFCAPSSRLEHHANLRVERSRQPVPDGLPTTHYEI